MDLNSCKTKENLIFKNWKPKFLLDQTKNKVMKERKKSLLFEQLDTLKIDEIFLGSLFQSCNVSKLLWSPPPFWTVLKIFFKYWLKSFKVFRFLSSSSISLRNIQAKAEKFFIIFEIRLTPTPPEKLKHKSSIFFRIWF